MSRSIKKWLRALLGALTLGALPAAADIANWDLGIMGQVINHGSSESNATATYTSIDNLGADYFNVPAGINYSSNDPFSPVLSYSPNPASPGLSSFTLNISDAYTVMNSTASLADGTTHIYASSSDNAAVETEAQDDIRMADQLTFTVGGTGTETISFVYRLDGVAGGSGSFTDNIDATLGSGNMVYEGDSSVPVNTSTASTGGWNSFAYSGLTNDGFTFVGTLTVTNGETLPFSFGQQLNCSYSDVCDFSNTGQFSLILPSDVSYTSASGVFLSQSSTVPEPGSLLLLGSGVMALALGRRRSSRRAPDSRR